MAKRIFNILRLAKHKRQQKRFIKQWIPNIFSMKVNWAGVKKHPSFKGHRQWWVDTDFWKGPRMRSAVRKLIIVRLLFFLRIGQFLQQRTGRIEEASEWSTGARLSRLLCSMAFKRTVWKTAIYIFEASSWFYSRVNEHNREKTE